MERHSSAHPPHAACFQAIDNSPNTPHYQPHSSESPTHCPTKPNLRSVLKTILLKDYYKPAQDSSPAHENSTERPPMVRMKDSEDYITARGVSDGEEPPACLIALLTINSFALRQIPGPGSYRPASGREHHAQRPRQIVPEML